MRIRPALIVAALAACASFASAAGLNVGDPAPALKVGKWLQGEPVSSFDKDKVYVVEFWATWCGPCKATIPHLNEMSKTYKDVVFIGQDVWERDVEQAKSAAFVQSMGDKMTYRVATDDRADGGAGAMATSWMEAAGQNGIPTAFVVNKGGTIAWIGHPMELEPVLKQVVAGSFDAEAAKKAAQAHADEQDAAKPPVQKDFEATVTPLLQSKDFAGAATALDALATKYPEQKPQVLQAKFNLMLQAKQYDVAYSTADEIAAAGKDDAEVLNSLAWLIVDSKGIEKRDLDRAEKYATRAAEITQMKDPQILDTLARVYADKGNNDKAIELETKAVEFADGELKPELQKTLDGYKAKK